jgi:hypothetical protein
MENNLVEKIYRYDEKYFDSEIKHKLSEERLCLVEEKSCSGDHPSIQLDLKSLPSKICKGYVVLCYPKYMNLDKFVSSVCVWLCMLLWGFYIPDDEIRGKHGFIFNKMMEFYFKRPDGKYKSCNVDIYHPS